MRPSHAVPGGGTPLPPPPPAPGGTGRRAHAGAPAVEHTGQTPAPGPAAPPAAAACPAAAPAAMPATPPVGAPAPSRPAHRQPDPARGRWYDPDPGPLVRPYAMAGGRTGQGSDGARLDLTALVTGAPDPPAPAADSLLGPEHRTLLDLCRRGTQSVADLAADAGLPVTAVRVLTGDLLAAGLVRVAPAPAVELLSDERILRELIDGLRAL